MRTAFIITDHGQSFISDQTSGDGSGDGHNGFETQYQSINPT